MCELKPVPSVAVILAVVIGAGLATARADVVYQSDDPFGGFFGIEGIDIADVQSAAMRFVPNGDFRLDALQLWLWSDDVTGGHPVIVITLRNDDARGGQSRPGQTIYERWELALPTTGYFNPQLFDFASVLHPLLRSGARYWVTAESAAPLENCPVWALGQPHPGFISLCDPPGAWWAGQSGEAGALVVLGTAQRTPVLNANSRALP